MVRGGNINLIEKKHQSHIENKATTVSFQKEYPSKIEKSKKNEKPLANRREIVYNIGECAIFEKQEIKT